MAANQFVPEEFELMLSVMLLNCDYTSKTAFEFARYLAQAFTLVNYSMIK